MILLLSACLSEPELTEVKPVVQNSAEPKRGEKPSPQRGAPPIRQHSVQHKGQHNAQHNAQHKGQPPSFGAKKQQKGLHLEPNFSWIGEATDSPRSIVLISLDTVRADHLSIYGGAAQVPLLEQVASKGVQFSQAISHFPETALSHWSMMSSMLPEVHGNVPGNGGSIYKGPTLAEIASEHNYATAAVIGGVTMTDQSSGFSRGFSSYDDQFVFTQEDMSRDGLEVSNKAAAWISKHQEAQKEADKPQPYFLFAHYFDAHFPYTPSEEYRKAYATSYRGSLDGSDAQLRPYRDGQKSPTKEEVAHIAALYDAEIAELDAKLKPLLDVIDKDTIVVVTSDHGESFEHDYYFNHRAGLWDGIVHVPLVISAPQLPQGKEITAQVGLIDLLPTVLELAGLRQDSRFTGKSLLPLIHEAEGSKGRSWVYSITDPWMPDPQLAVRTEHQKWISKEEKELVYNLDTDPEEVTPSADIPSELKGAPASYKKLIQASAKDQASGKKRTIDKEECARLEALGYTTCQ